MRRSVPSALLALISTWMFPVGRDSIQWNTLSATEYKCERHSSFSTASFLLRQVVNGSLVWLPPSDSHCLESYAPRQEYCYGYFVFFSTQGGFWKFFSLHIFGAC